MKTRPLPALALVSVLLSTFFFLGGYYSSNSSFLSATSPGPISPAHAQLRAACESCHAKNGFGQGQSVANEKCLSCHLDDLELAEDSHGPTAFSDPRNAFYLERLDAARCVACHSEHDERTLTHSLWPSTNLPVDACVACHQDIITDSQSHENFNFPSCADIGCHNYHDNRFLHADYLEPKIETPWLLPFKLEKTPRGEPSSKRSTKKQTPPLKMIWPAEAPYETAHKQDWQKSGHAEAGVNCGGCHAQSSDRKNEPSPDFSLAELTKKPGPEICADCHARQTAGFLKGRHGMRFSVGLSAVKPRESHDLKFRDDAMETPMNCNSCHRAHQYKLQDQASLFSCLGCHDDEHSRAFNSSPHRLRASMSCQSCHMPKSLTSESDEQGKTNTSTSTNHNQNHNLRPREKMIDLCAECHGVNFVLLNLDDKNINSNFSTPNKNSTHQSIEMIRKKLFDTND